VPRGAGQSGEDFQDFSKPESVAAYKRLVIPEHALAEFTGNG
jgi:hypothetical protein